LIERIANGVVVAILISSMVMLATMVVLGVVALVDQVMKATLTH